MLSNVAPTEVAMLRYVAWLKTVKGKPVHVALDDAIEQGALFCNMLKENRHG